MNNKLHALTIITIIASFCIAPLLCMDEKAAVVYQSTCKEINKKSNKKLTEYINNACIKDTNQQIALLENKLIQYKNDLDDREKITLNNIKEHNCINEKAWQLCMTAIEKITEFNQNTKHLPLPNVIHDPNFPKDLKLMFEQEFTKNGINSQRIEFLCVTNKPFLSQTKGCMPHWSLKDDATIFMEYIVPGRLIINLDYISVLSPIIKKGFVLDTVQQINHKLGICYNTIATFEPLFTDTSNTINNSHSVKTLNILLNIHTILRVSLINKKSAYLMRKYNKLNREHFTIDIFK